MTTAATRAVLFGSPLDFLEELARRLDELLVWLDDAPFFFDARPSAADLAIASQLRMLQSDPTPQGAALVAPRRALMAYATRVDALTAPNSIR